MYLKVIYGTGQRKHSCCCMVSALRTKVAMDENKITNIYQFFCFQIKPVVVSDFSMPIRPRP